MVILSVDFGRARTGIAICDPSEMLASPVTVINEKYVPNLVQKVASLAAEKKAELIVVGLPVNMDGSEGESAQNARRFAESLRETCGIPVDMLDERCTTMEAHVFLNNSCFRKTCCAGRLSPRTSYRQAHAAVR